MASDSRLSLNTTNKQDGNTVVNISVGQSDSSYKTFLIKDNRVGISTYGAADIKGVPIAGYIESFIAGQVVQTDSPEQVANKLLTYFKQLAGPPKTFFLVAGYRQDAGKEPEQYVYTVSVTDNNVSRVNKSDQQGAQWGGENDILSRLILSVGLLDDQGQLLHPAPHSPILWQFFTLQDAIDFAKYAIQVTIDSFKFQPRPKTVGGAVDILVIKPNEAFWVQRKELHA